MKRTSLVVAGFSAMIALGLIGYGCTSGDNVNGTGGSKGSGGQTGGGQGGATGGGQGGSSGGLVTCPSPAPGDKSTCTLSATLVTPCTKNCGIKNTLAQKPCACITSTVTPPTAWDCSNQGPCVYPAGFDKTCYSLATAPPACPAAVVTGLTACTNTAGATCGPLCGSATVASYSTGTVAAPGTPKPGYCACTNGFWQCASPTEWPM